MVDGGNGEVRLAAKVILIDEADCVLLFRGGDPGNPAAGTWWFPPGGGLEPGETVAEAARREVHEETGLWLGELGRIVFHRHAEFRFDDVDVVAEEDYYLVRVERFELSSDGWTDVERDVIVEHRWWSLDDLGSTRDVVYPDGLAALIETATPHQAR